MFIIWLLFLTGLAPVLGFVQSGPQLAADRYTYIASYTVSLAAIGCLVSASRSRVRSLVFGTTCLLLVVGCGWQTRRYMAYWLEDERLWTRALTIRPDNDFAAVSRAGIRLKKGDIAAARADLEQAVSANPHNVKALVNLGALALSGGEWKRAADLFDAALAARPATIPARTMRAQAWVHLGKKRQAMDDLESILRDAGTATAHRQQAAAMLQRLRQLSPDVSE
jgi:tetratricopeptide (TPR) repeat protein